MGVFVGRVKMFTVREKNGVGGEGGGGIGESVTVGVVI